MPGNTSAGWADAWAAARPITADTAAGQHYATLAGADFDALPPVPGLRAHSGLDCAEEAGRRWPAILGRIKAPGGAVVGLVVRMLSPRPPHGLPPLLLPVRRIGGRGRGAVRIRPAGRSARWRGTATLAIGLDMALALAALRHPTELWAVADRSGLLTVALPASVRRVVIVAPPDARAGADFAFMLDRAAALLRVGGCRVREEQWSPAAAPTWRAAGRDDASAEAAIVQPSPQRP